MLEYLEKSELIELIHKLKKENNELKEKLYGFDEKTEIAEENIKNNISNEEKVKLFMSIFNARTDVYAKRWTSSKTGKSGYSPVCKNEFSKYKCDKLKIKCSECVHRDLEPLTEDVVLKHLKGEITIGIYPLLLGDICNFLAIDFDKKTYEKDVNAFWSICDDLNIPIYVERSRSGNGAHVWMFFEESIPARVARKMGNILLTKTMDKVSLDLDSYDRLFPNQDTLPNGGFGNLIALPFQGISAKEGNTIFVNKYFEVYDNQIEILKNIVRIKREEVYNFIKMNGIEDYDEPVIEESDDEIPNKVKVKDTIFTNNIECILDNQIYVKKLKLLPNERTYLKRLASFTNPKFYELQKLRMPVYSTPRIISCFEEDERFLILPRGCLDAIKDICDRSNVELKVKDTRQVGKNIDFNFNGILKSKQTRAMNELVKNDNGVLCAATGFGKTVVASKIISELKTNTLILVNRTSLLEQWKERLSFFLGINKKEIGQIGAGKNKQTNVLDIASLQTLYKQDNIDDILKEYGLVIIDECHHISAFSFEQVLKNVRAKYVYGLTATPIRKDGQHPIIYMQCGNIRYRVSNKELKQNKEMEHTVVVKKTNYSYTPTEIKDKISISEILTDIAKSNYRNNIIVKDIKGVVKDGRVPIVLTERVEHLEILKNKIEDLNLNVPIVIYKGNMGKKKLKEINSLIEEADREGNSRIILATSTSIGEGFDDSRLDTLFLTMPVSWKGRIIQYVGRLHREHIEKEKVIVYDYLDNMKVLEKMYSRRIKGYKVAGYEIVEEMLSNTINKNL